MVLTTSIVQELDRHRYGWSHLDVDPVQLWVIVSIDAANVFS